MKTSRFLPSPLRLLVGVALAALVVVAARAESKKKNPASKFYVADVSGEASVDTGERVDDLAKRSVYNAEGTVVETKRADSAGDRKAAYSTMVYSNGTGAFFDADTRVEVKQFVQEPFIPNRSDIETEPSISQTQAFVARGAIGLCNSKLVAGSAMVYSTPHASVNIRGRKVVIEAGSNVTKISMLEGESTVRGGSMDMGGHTVHSGEQALIYRAPPGQPSRIEIQPIPPGEAPQLDDKVAMACMAKKTVYFEERERKVDSTEGRSNAAVESTGSSGKSSSSGGVGEGSAPGRVTIFDSTTGGSSSTSSAGGTVREIVPVEIVPANQPTQFTVSPATITTPGRPGG